MRKIFLSVSFLLLSSWSIAQVSSRVIFSRVTKKEGLASNTVFEVARDPQGFLWLATQNGLQRYDGHRFLSFRHIPGKTNSIPVNGINHLFLDKKGRLWLLFDKTVGIFNTTDFTFSPISINSTVMMIRKIMEDGKGQIILFADSKQLVYDEGKHFFEKNLELPSLPPGYIINDLAIDTTTDFNWFTGKQGSLQLHPKSKDWFSSNYLFPGLDSFSKIKNPRYPFVASDGTRWLVNWIPFSAIPPVLYSYQRKGDKLQKYENIRPWKPETYHEIWGLFQQSNGRLWIHGMGLLAYFSPAENRFININSDPFQQNGIYYTYVSRMYEDNEKNVWVCTNEGLYRFNTDAQVFRNIKNRRPNDTTAFSNSSSTIVHTRNNGIWVSTWGSGIFSYNEQLQPIPNPVTQADPLNKNLHAGCMIQKKNGEIWIGTQTGELKIYDPATNITSSVRHSLLMGETITQLLDDGAGNTWMGSTSGLLVKCEKGNWRDTANAFKRILADGGDILRLFEDSRGHLWICTATNGLYEMDSKTGKLINQYHGDPDRKKGLLNNGASDIVQYNDSTLLIASEGLCILNTRTNTFTYLTPNDGLPAEHITNLILDKQKRLWVGCDGGLYRLNLDNKLYITYDAADGITSDIMQVSGAAILRDGRIAIATPNDFLLFDPESTIDKKEVPPVKITGIKSGEAYIRIDSVQQLGKLKLRHDNTFIRFDLSTLTFRDQYYKYYRLEGLDDTWKQVTNNEILYQYLPPGDYTLQLKSQNGEGVESKTITSLIIEVTPPFWKTWWFYCVIALLIMGLIFWFDNERIRRKTAILQMRSHIADDLHKEVNTTLSNITILSEIARMKAETEPGKSIEFIEQIRTKSQNMTLAMDDILWNIDPKNDSLEKFMLRFREYVNSLEVKHNDKVDVLIDEKAERVQLKMSMRNNVFWLFKNGISNMLRTGAKNCRVHITYEKPNLVYTLEFDTATQDKALLTNLRQRTELSDKLSSLNAKLVFREHKSSASFILSIPLKKDGL
jgi:ligand-binding sensor domain-containing protein